MNTLRIFRLASAAGQHRPNRSSPAINALLLTGVLAIGGLMAAPAKAANLQITTTGTITAGTDPINLFGTNVTSLVGDSYTLTLLLFGPGPAYFTDGSGTYASDNSDPLTGYVTATVDGTSATTQLLNMTSADLTEDQYDLFASNSGLDGANNYANVSQELSCSSQCVPYADLLTSFSYTLQPGDIGSDSYTFELPGNPGGDTVTFTGASTSINYAVPEPGSLALLASGLLGLGMLVHRRRA
jgi:hypothetical protein